MTEGCVTGLVIQETDLKCGKLVKQQIVQFKQKIWAESFNNFIKIKKTE